MIAVLADEKALTRGLVDSGVPAAKASAIIVRDENEADVFGQKVRDTVQLADYFVRNDADHADKLARKAERFLDLVFNVEVISPSVDETSMTEAFAAAANSACLSRQVGAAVCASNGELLGLGWNDVPRSGGGLYSPSDGENDNRCFRWGGMICHNDDRKDRLYKQVLAALKDRKILKDGIADDQVLSAVMSTDVRNLIEFSRAVHAEMAALLSVARSAKSGLTGGTMYVTTFPCHSCARHIVAAGIAKVVYIEPYPKSLAIELHRDALFSGFESADGKSVQFVQYEGVAPRNTQRLFKHGIERKANGKARSVDRKLADP